MVIVATDSEPERLRRQLQEAFTRADERRRQVARAIRRSPDRSNADIARECHVRPATVAAVREALRRKL